jgi:putative tryptophan/tyrosine transport system substrate-binding protein
VTRREFITLLGGAAAAWPPAARAQQPLTRMPRIGWLVIGSPPSYRFSLAAFRDGLKALGHVEGQNISIEYRWAEGNAARLPELAKDLVNKQVDIILAGDRLAQRPPSRPPHFFPLLQQVLVTSSSLG